MLPQQAMVSAMSVAKRVIVLLWIWATAAVSMTPLVRYFADINTQGGLDTSVAERQMAREQFAFHKAVLMDSIPRDFDACFTRFKHQFHNIQSLDSLTAIEAALGLLLGEVTSFARSKLDDAHHLVV